MRSKPNSKAYDEGYERIFGKKQPPPPRKETPQERLERLIKEAEKNDRQS